MKNKLLLFSIVWLILMFFLSHQPGPDTTNISGGIAKFISRFSGLDIQMVHMFIRHAAHVLLYMVLAIGMGMLLHQAGIRWFWILCLLILISVADEMTKPLIVGRHCETVDIGRNCLGSVLGLGLIRLQQCFDHN